MAIEYDYKAMWIRLRGCVAFWIKENELPVSPLILEDIMDLIQEANGEQAKS